MLEPVALHQTGFQVPGLAQDARGVVVGTHAAVLLLGVDRLVALLRLLSEELPLDDVLPSLRIELVKNPLGAQAYLLRLACTDSLLLDRLARPARLCGAVLCVGAGKHFVPYRDRRAPLGYDARELLGAPAATADYVLYSAASAQPFVRVREVGLLPLLGQLSLLACAGGAAGALRALGADPGTDVDPGAGSLAEPLWLTVPLGLLARTARYLWERGAHAEVALPELLPPPGSPGGEGTELTELLLLRIAVAPVGLLARLLPVPGLRLYQPVGEQLAVELGYAHPLRLASLARLFAPGRVYLFAGDRRGYLALPVARRIPLERLVELHGPLSAGPPGEGGGEPPVRAALAEKPARAGERLHPRTVERPHGAQGAAAAPVILRVPLQLVAETAGRGQRTPTATLVPWPRVLWLSRLLYALPATLLSGLQAACLDEGVLIVGAQGVSGLPLGTLLYEPTPHVYIPLGREFLPRLPGELLTAQLGGVSDRCIVFLPGLAQPLALPRSHLQPLTQQLLSPLLPTVRSATTQSEPLRPELQNAPVSALSTWALWPLWGGLEDDSP